MGTVIVTLFLSLFASCKKEDEAVVANSQNYNNSLPIPRTGGYWVEHIVKGTRVFDHTDAILCLESSDDCFSYYTWVQGPLRSVVENDCYLYFPEYDEGVNEPYPTNVFIHVSDLVYDENSGLLKFRIIN